MKTFVNFSTGGALAVATAKIPLAFSPPRIFFCLVSAYLSQKDKESHSLYCTQICMHNTLLSWLFLESYIFPYANLSVTFRQKILFVPSNLFSLELPFNSVSLLESLSHLHVIPDVVHRILLIDIVHVFGHYRHPMNESLSRIWAMSMGLTFWSCRAVGQYILVLTPNVGCFLKNNYEWTLIIKHIYWGDPHSDEFRFRTPGPRFLEMGNLGPSI